METRQDEFDSIESKSPEEIIKWAFEKFGDKVALSSSYGAEDMVLMDMAKRVAPKLKIFTLDTGRLPEETYALMAQSRERYGMSVDVYFPDSKRVEEMVRTHGPNLFYESVDLRKMCCGVRKVEPLARAFVGLDAWITGLRREQAATRADTKKVTWDDLHKNVVKISPLADWTEDQVWSYIKAHNVPYNELHDKGYPSIGCAPCTRAIRPGEDKRAGRWWWENGTKECGLHEARKPLEKVHS